jgi:hypothetical protein
LWKRLTRYKVGYCCAAGRGLQPIRIKLSGTCLGRLFADKVAQI